MKYTFFTVGPSELFPTMEKHMQEAIENQIGSLSHRSAAFEQLFTNLSSSLKQLLTIPNDYNIFFVSSGTEAMERAIQNLVEKTSFHFVNGSFSTRFYDIAKELGKNAQKTEAAFGDGFDLAEVDIPEETELICVTHNETSSGVMLPIEEIAALKEKYPHALIAVDMVSSAPYGSIDFKTVDLVFFSVQKLFGLPAGLGVLIVSPQALQKTKDLHSKGTAIGSYHNFLSLENYSLKHQTPETPSVLHMFLLERVMNDFLSIGLSQIRKEIDEKAKILYNFFDTHSEWSTFVKEKKFRSPTIVVAEIGKNQKAIKEYLQKNGMIISGGYGPYKDTQIRIANFPAVSKEKVYQLLKLFRNFPVDSKQ